jgi:hypothetical protein
MNSAIKCSMLQYNFVSMSAAKPEAKNLQMVGKTIYFLAANGELKTFSLEQNQIYLPNAFFKFNNKTKASVENNIL